jgi:hypothetical protein
VPGKEIKFCKIYGPAADAKGRLNRHTKRTDAGIYPAFC